MKAPITRAALGIAAFVAIAVLANWLVSLTPAGNRGTDFTENKVFTLSDGTKSILGELDTKVVIRYYASRNAEYTPNELKLHTRRVDDLLKEYKNVSNGQIRIENIDPEPDTDAEDSANLDGIRSIDQQGSFYLGIAVSALDKKVVLPFLNPNEETMLEYQISKAIAEVTTPVKPVIGIMSAFDLAGMPAMMPGQQPQQPWVIYQQLKESFDLRDLSMTPEKIDPKEIKVLLLFHPAEISKEAEFLVDQYLLSGGTVVACLDSFSLAAQMVGGQPNPMTGQPGGPPTSSTLPTLLSKWGVEFISDKVLADPIYATPLGERSAISVLSLPQSAMPQKDNIITKAIDSIILYLPGAIKRTGSGVVATNSLVRSSDKAGFVDPVKASRLDPSLDTSLKSEGTAYDLVTHLSGNFKTAFPEGKPKAVEPEPAPQEEKKEEAEKPKEESLKEAVKPGNIFLIADVDAFYDRFAYNVQNFGGGMQMASPSNGNAGLLFNLLDQAVGSKYLIGSRSRVATRRPFTVINEMEDEFKKKVGGKIEEFEQKQREAVSRLEELQAQRSESSNPYGTPEQKAEITKLQEQQVIYSRLIREQQKELRRDKDKLAGKIIRLNVAAIPALVILIGLGLFLKRRSSTRAR